MGPDEYHDAYLESDKPGINNNSYTNIFTVWVLSRVLDLLDLLPSDAVFQLKELLDLKEEETERWSDISKKMRVVFHKDGIITQFEGYEDLQEFPWDEYRKKYGHSMRLDRILEAEGDSCNRYKVSKQADVLMLFYLFSAKELEKIFNQIGYSFNREDIPRMIDYYLQRTSHGSTLSYVIHSWVNARSNREESWELFKWAIEADISDAQGGTTEEGIHLGAMAGTVNLLEGCYLGVSTLDDKLSLHPHLPDPMKRLTTTIHYRGRSLDIDLTREKLKVCAKPGVGHPIKISFCEQDPVELSPGEEKEFFWTLSVNSPKNSDFLTS